MATTLFDLMVKIGLDDKLFKRSIKETESSMEKARYASERMSNATDTQKNKIAFLTVEYKTAREKVERLSQAFNESARANGIASEKTRELAKGLNEAEKEAGEAKTKLDAVTDSTEDFNKKAKGFMKTAGKVAAAAAGAIASVGGWLAKTGLEYNSQMEDYTTNFGVMLGGAEQAAKKVEELKTMAAKTPFGMSELAEATQTLLAFQVPAEKTNDILRMLGDVSLGDKEKLKGLALVFGQVSSAGKLQGQDLMQLINQGFNPLNYISKRTGESMEELKERMSKGGISAQEVEQAFVDATSAGGQFNGGMEAASTTMSGLKSTLEDTVNSKLGEFFEGVSEKATEALPSIIEFVENIDVEKALENMEKFKNTMEVVIPIVTALTTAVIAYKTAMAISTVIDTVKKATDGMTLSQILLNAAMNANPVMLVVSVLAALVAGLITAYTTNEKFRENVKEAWESVKNGAIRLKDSVVTIFSKKIPKAFHDCVDFVKTKWNTLVDKAKTWGKDLLDNFIKGIKEKWENLKTTVSQTADTIKAYLGFSEPEKGPLSNFHTYAPDMMNLFAKGIKDNENVITNQIDKSFNFGERTISANYGLKTGSASGFGGAVNNFGGINITVNAGDYANGREFAEQMAERFSEMAEEERRAYA